MWFGDAQHAQSNTWCTAGCVVNLFIKRVSIPGNRLQYLWKAATIQLLTYIITLPFSIGSVYYMDSQTDSVKVDLSRSDCWSFGRLLLTSVRVSWRFWFWFPGNFLVINVLFIAALWKKSGDANRFQIYFHIVYVVFYKLLVLTKLNITKNKIEFL